MNKLSIVLYITLLLFTQINAEKFPYKNSDIPIEERVNDLISRMNIEEKFWQLFMIPGDLSEGKEKYKNGIFGFQVSTKGSSSNAAEQILSYDHSESAKSVAKKINEIQKYFVEETELGIPIIPFDEALHGLIRKDATAFPQAIGLAASWNTELMSEVAEAIAMEVKTRGIRQILSPVINISRDVRWGRVEESYGEDPFLTSKMGIAFIDEFEKEGIITTPKHFIANVGDGGRDSYPIHFNERLMEEIYFPAFKEAVQVGKARSLMISYNSYDGTPCTANSWLLNEKLKDEWGFNGFVISDAGAIGGANVLHFTTSSYGRSTKEAIEGGLDVIFQTAYSHFELFFQAVEDGLIDENTIDDALRRVLRIKFELGLFENPYVNEEEAAKWNNCDLHREIAKKAAQESIVLLKNEKSILPFSKNIKSFAVIGKDALEGRLGGYSGPGNNIITILDGIENKLGDDIDVQFAEGPGRDAHEYSIIPKTFLIPKENDKSKKGLLGQYFSNPEFKGDPEIERIDSEINFRWTLFSPDPRKFDYDWYSVRWTGKLIGPVTGKINIGIEGNDGYRLYINDKLVIDNWIQKTYSSKLTEYSFEKDKEYDIKLEFYTTAGNTRCKLVWDFNVDKDWKDKINQAVDIVEKSDAAVIVVGIEEGEFRDRAHLSLPGHQETLIKACAEIGKPIAVVLVGGSAITMNNWINEIDGIIAVWYPGEVGGLAVADVLFGDYNPAGRLPITFPVDEAQLPLYYNHKPTGRGDDYMNLTGQPLFPFGFGLSYTQFEYKNLKLSKTNINDDDSIKLDFDLTNIGKYSGDEVVQLYIKDLYASVAQPIIQLKGFQRIHLSPGEAKRISFNITPELLKIVNKDLNRIVEPGDFRIMIGSSSKDIKLRETITVN